MRRRSGPGTRRLERGTSGLRETFSNQRDMLKGGREMRGLVGNARTFFPMRKEPAHQSPSEQGSCRREHRKVMLYTPR